MSLFNLSLIFFFQSQSQQRKEGLIIGILLFIFIVIMLVVAKVSDYEEEKEKESWRKINQNDFLKHQKNFEDSVSILANSVSKCKKCENNYYKIWNINSSIEVRCDTCKRKQIINLDESDFSNFFDPLSHYVNNISKIPEEKNEKIRNLKLSIIKHDFFGLRRNTPYIRAIGFLGLKTVTVTQNNTEEKKSRRISQSVKDKVWRRDEGKCIECGSNEKLEFDHIIPFSKGGANTYRNVQLLCENCNRSKSNQIG